MSVGFLTTLAVPWYLIKGTTGIVYRTLESLRHWSDGSLGPCPMHIACESFYSSTPQPRTPEYLAMISFHQENSTSEFWWQIDIPRFPTEISTPFFLRTPVSRGQATSDPYKGLSIDHYEGHLDDGALGVV